MRTIILLLFLTSSQQIFAQADTTIPPPDLRAQYLQKSKSQMTAARILSGTGAALFITGFLLVGDDLAGIFDPEDKDNGPLADVLIITGGAAMLGSIPLYIAGRRNRQKAEEISAGLFMENWQGPRFASNMQNKFPAIGIRFELK